MLWTEKYRPTKLEHIIGQEHFVLDAKTWVEENNMPNVLLYGNAGNGKTGAGIVLGKEILKDSFKENFYEVNASDDRRLEMVRTTIKEVAQSRSIGGVPFKIMLLDEMDGMTGDAQNALKRIMERYANNIRFVITCNNRNKIVFPIQSRCANYHFKPLSNNSVKQVLKSILSKENIDRFSDEELDSFIYAMNGDMRRAITELQAAKSSGTTLKKQVSASLDDFKKLIMKMNQRNTSALGDIHDMIYYGLSMKEICLGLHDAVIEMDELDSTTKFKFLRTIGESEWRSTTMTPKVLASWLVGNI